MKIHKTILTNQIFRGTFYVAAVFIEGVRNKLLEAIKGKVGPVRGSLRH